MKLPSFSKRNSKQMLAGLAAVCCALSLSANGTEFENLGTLGQEVLETARFNYTQSPENVSVQVSLNGLDNRLKLVKCDQKHDLAVQDSLGVGGHVNVSVSCRGLNRWAILVPITAAISRNVPVANRNLPVGTLLTEEDFRLETRDMNELRLGYHTEMASLIGKQVKFAINPGDTVKTSWVDAPITIRRGDEVSLEAHIGQIKVVTRGTAISDGRLGQQIRVKNNQTDKIVNGRVIAQGQVSTL